MISYYYYNILLVPNRKIYFYVLSIIVIFLLHHHGVLSFSILHHDSSSLRIISKSNNIQQHHSQNQQQRYTRQQHQQERIMHYLCASRNNNDIIEIENHDDDEKNQRSEDLKRDENVVTLVSSTTSTEEVVEVVPNNLRRKINAKRPSLGHVVGADGKKMKNTKQTSTATAILSGRSGNPMLRPQGKEREMNINNPSMLRISSGIARGRKLYSPNVYLRPMMSKVREAVFSTFISIGLYDNNINNPIRNTKKIIRHLDIFAGSGSVGLESISRGATHCTFIDLSSDCCSCTKRNIELCGFDNNNNYNYNYNQQQDQQQNEHLVIQADAFQALRNPRTIGIPNLPYQIITICPPYEEIIYADLLDAIISSPVITDNTIVLIEYPIELGCLPHVIRNEDGNEFNNVDKNVMIGIRNRKYGRTVIAMYIVNPTGNLPNAISRPEEFINL